MRKLNLKQKNAADNFIKVGDKKDALLLAGYTPGTVKGSFGEDFFERENIREYIKERVSGEEALEVADEREIMVYLTELLRGKITEEVVVNKELVNKTPTLRERSKAAELLGRHYGLYGKNEKSKKAEGIEIKVDVEE
ncbi:MAG: terminase small subunit [Clostridiales bacterium]|nr:terminase small subunit [Clostridiales bacterium]